MFNSFVGNTNSWSIPFAQFDTLHAPNNFPLLYSTFYCFPLAEIKCSVCVLQSRICDESSQLHDLISKVVYELKKTETGIHGSGGEFEDRRGGLGQKKQEERDSG